MPDGSPSTLNPEANQGPCPRPADLRAEIERYERTAQVNDWDGPRYRMAYRVLGEGPPLVVSRGISGGYKGFALVFNRLAERFKTIIYEYPGDQPDDGADLASISHEDLADDLIGLLDHLGIDRAFPLGVSFGSTVVLRALHRAPERFPKAVLQGGFAFRRFTIYERLALALGRCVPGPTCNLPMHRRVVSWNNQIEFPSIIGDRWPIFVEHNGLTPIAALAHRVSLLTRMDLRPILPEIPTEVLAIQGNEDRIVPRPFFDEINRLLPNLRPKLMPVAGHQIHYTHAEWYARIIEDFLLDCSRTGCDPSACDQECPDRNA